MMAMNSYLGKTSRSYGHKFQPLSIGNDRKQQNKYSELINKFGVSRIGGAVGLFIMGFTLFITGLYWLYIGHHGSFPISFLGMLCLVPGAYGIYEIIGTFYGWSGFQDLSRVSQSIDDDWTYAV